VHHSTIGRETDSNYGFNLSVWDRLFATYIAQPERGHLGMTIGLAQFPGDPPTHLGWSLALPFRRA
jgi:sterol desaturase/sphingolipid hydroxylase (fatty acid hydroxylase superfamily)